MKYPVGTKLGHLTIIEELEPIKNHRRVLCKCDCGNTDTLFLTNIVQGRSSRCSQCSHNNRPMYKRNKTGHVGISYHKTKEKWQAHCSHNHKLYYIGSFDSREEAIKARETYIKERF